MRGVRCRSGVGYETDKYRAFACSGDRRRAWPVASAIRHFRGEFEYHVKYPEKVVDPKHFEKEPFRSEKFETVSA